MRRTLFGRPPAVELNTPARASVREALLFDVVDHIESANFALGERRLASWMYAPWLLLSGHLALAISLFVEAPAEAGGGALAGALVPLVFSLALDSAAGITMAMWRRLQLAPHTVSRLMCGYLAVTGMLWAVACFAAGSGRLADPTFVTVAMASGFFLRSIVAVSSPPLALVNTAVAFITTFLFSSNSDASFAIEWMSVLMIAYSVLITQKSLFAGRTRLALESQAKKALNFVDEFENSGRGWFWETDSLGTLSYVSRQLADDFQCEPEALLGRQFTDLLSVDQASESLEERKTLGFHLSARFPFSDVVVSPASEEDVHWSLSGNPIFDERGRFLGFRGIGTDLTEQRKSEREISRLARFDSLTALPNRAMMRQTLDEALRNAAHRKKGCALFMIDLDRFKNVNDTLGHPVGDALLRQVAERLKSVMGNHGQVGRLGGDEFQAVLPGAVELGLLESLARTLIEQVSRPYMIEGYKVTIGASVGIVIGDPGRASADAMVRNADLALYAAKAAGRGKHRLYEPSMHSEAAERQVLENDLRQAIERGELSVHYQPIVRTAAEEISGFEALVRWQHPTRGAISPAKFIPLAEEAGIVGKIGEWVLRTALEEAANWPDQVRVAVNLSPLQFNDPGVVKMVAGHLRETGVRASRLELEITEGVFLAEGESTDETFARLKELGVRLALDDFGTGYSSLGYLKKAPFDKIKIDQSFVRGAASTSATNRNAAIIRAIVTLAETLGMDTCAEGVETHDDLQLIRELGVSMVQGYIFGKPEPAETSRKIANSTTMEAAGFACIREPRHRLMRRALASIGGQTVELRLRNISSMGALVDCSKPVAPGDELTIDIVGVGPVHGLVRWAQTGNFGIQFAGHFDLGRLAPTKEKKGQPAVTSPWHTGRREAS
ncbi:putative bifunctional diguanylate cyclase/phosphodiesterase [Sphingomonas agri]|uniref:putative bifunctional diguanylate cyclase/phosphodiesterase n=1 Tax=Sphingomonas agri TaxID=1813878 RepID=UPI00311E5706